MGTRLKKSPEGLSTEADILQLISVAFYDMP